VAEDEAERDEDRQQEIGGQVRRPGGEQIGVRAWYSLAAGATWSVAMMTMMPSSPEDDDRRSAQPHLTIPGTARGRAGRPG